MSINFEEFKKVDLRVGTVLEASRVEGSEKLLKLIIDLGAAPIEEGKPLDPSRGKRQIISGIGKSYAPETLIGKQIVLVVNLEPRMMMGLESQGMVLAASGTDGLSLLFPDKPLPPGVQIT